MSAGMEQDETYVRSAAQINFERAMAVLLEWEADSEARFLESLVDDVN